MKNNHNAIELTPPIEDVSRIALEQAFYFNLGDHLNGKHERANQINSEYNVFKKKIISQRFRRVGADGYEASERTKSNYPLHPGFIYPLQANLSVQQVVVLRLQLLLLQLVYYGWVETRGCRIRVHIHIAIVLFGYRLRVLFVNADWTLII